MTAVQLVADVLGDNASVAGELPSNELVEPPHA
jgi:hypothetical protein